MNNNIIKIRFARQLTPGITITLATLCFCTLANFALNHGGWLAPLIIAASWLLARIAENWLRKFINRIISSLI